TLVVDVAAYSVKYPFEPYDWYTMPALLCLMVGAACGVGVVTDSITWLWRRGRHTRVTRGAISTLIGIPLVAAVTVPWFAPEAATAVAGKAWSSHQEYDRAQAGRWVAAHTPGNFVVFTDWGNPAVYSERQVIDGSFLNQPYQSGDLIGLDKPQVLILQNNPGSTPTQPVFAFDTNGYRLVKLFDRSYQAGLGYFYAVLVRAEDVSRLT
ncbi:MAG TPA: hypothetical protein VKR22_00680, partial [Acidimicrobiales bacterium]|nr:hypothetical protein [Acidimicrobiales bacterium]